MSLTAKDGFPYYFGLANTSSLRQLFSERSTFIFLESITDHKALYRYAADKWSIKQVVGHITDHERIKSFRAFLFSRQMEVELWGYDQDLLVNNSNFDNLDLGLLIQDFKNVRNATISFIDTLTKKQLSLAGKIGKREVTLEEYLKSIIGHEIHHIKIIKEKYL
jgi:uncharacterized damage-inducible protein DinB